MATNSATEFEGPMDTSDFVDYVSQFGPLLVSGETIAPGFTVSPTTEGAALGFEISGAMPPFLEVGDENIGYWVQINVSNKDDVVFDNDGTQIPVEVTFPTTSSRIYQRTFLVTVKQL